MGKQGLEPIKLEKAVMVSGTWSATGAVLFLSGVSVGLTVLAPLPSNLTFRAREALSHRHSSDAHSKCYHQRVSLRPQPLGLGDAASRRDWGSPNSSDVKGNTIVFQNPTVNKLIYHK